MGWSKKPTDFSTEVLKQADDFTKKVTGYALQQVILRSPVDTGAYRGNHRVSIASPENTFDLSIEDKGGSKALADGMRVISASNFGGIVYIQNCLPYSLKLENGWSQQAPQGVYTLAFQETVNKFK